MMNKSFRRLAAGVLLCSIVQTSVTVSAEQPEIQVVNEAVSLNSAVALSKKDILKIARYHIQNYMKDDIQTRGKSIRVSSDFLELYDLAGNVFAYMIPLMEGGKEIGFMTVGAIADGYDVYSIRIEDNAVEAFRAQRDKELAAGAADARVIFLPPYKYFVESTNGDGQKYADVTSPSAAAADVTALITNNKSAIQANYRSIRSSENQQHLQKIMKTADPLQAVPSEDLLSPSASAALDTSAAAAATVTKEDVSLSSERNFSQFVPIEYPKGSGVYSYGGDQGWYAKSSEQSNGCGPVAAANITNYMAKVTNATKYGKLYTGSTLSHADFLAHMNTMYSRINPGKLGELSIWDFADDVETYAKDKGVTLKRVTSSASFTLDNTATYIKAGLNSNVPVGTLNLSKFSDYEFEWHWMTITKYYRDVNDNRWIAVSTWGRRESINYRTHFDAMKAFEGIIGSPGLIYFS
ncbi:hypothetical protein ACFFSY_28390 [Paenibacillus aurantiacus]|uniref:Peptidase C39-like domain-containing protein n=1 Tax=Paenibacillus aurantiacus TaxID=1936118 RepID=A0ABV5KZM9_9BACL